VVRKGFDLVPGLVDTVTALGLAKKGDDPMIVVACELVLEALVARRKISRSDAGAYGRAERESRRRPNQQDYFG
ncbi:MAG: magnesium chelatase, partial [Gemmatimonadaceae bacterium]